MTALRSTPQMSGASAARGFTLIEVLVSLLILSIGLLGLGLLQASSLKASFGANQRTIATNLAYEVVDMMRANRRLAYNYAYIVPADFAAINPATCNPQPYPSGAAVVSDDYVAWECRLARALPVAGGGGATVTLVTGVVTVNINWNDTRFANANDQVNNFTVISRL